MNNERLCEITFLTVIATFLFGAGLCVFAILYEPGWAGWYKLITSIDISIFIMSFMLMIILAVGEGNDEYFWPKDKL